VELRHLRYFVVAAEAENFHRASERLNLVQPALSRQIRDLETQLGVELFERLPRGVHLTPAGRSYAADAHEILAAVEAANKTAKRIHSGEQGELRIGISDLASTSTIVMTAIRKFRSRLPLVTLQFFPLPTMAQVEALGAERLDIGLIYGYESLPDTVKIREVASYQLLLAVANDHRLATQDRVYLDDLRDEELIVPAITPIARDQLVAQLRFAGFEPKVSQSAPSTEMTLGLVAAGAGIAIVNSSVANRVSAFVVMKPLADLNLQRRLMIAWKKGPPGTLVTQFDDIITETQAELVSEAEDRPASDRQREPVA